MALATVAATVAVAATDHDDQRDSAGRPLGPSEALSSDVFAAAAVAPGSRVTFYPAFAFRPRGTGSTTLVDDSSRGCVYGSDELLTTPVLLPDGAVIDAISVYARPSAGSVSGYLSVFDTTSFPGSGPLLTDIFGAVTSGTGDQIRRDDTPSDPAAAVVDNSTKNFVLQVFSNAAGEWFCGIQVEWTPPNSGQVLTPVRPCLVFDTRTEFGGQGPFAARQTKTIDLVRTDHTPIGGEPGGCDLPSDPSALLLTINILRADSFGGIRVWENGVAASTNAVMLFEKARKATAPAVVEVDAQGRIRLRNNSDGETHLQLLVQGWYGPQY